MKEQLNNIPDIIDPGLSLDYADLILTGNEEEIETFPKPDN
ncbi:hypothetical protein [Pareuzebyella sediminis]|nr:hypothetical protein [Pareuzebyella sediminis]